ncbi:MAG: HAD family hydrolase, partial [Haloferula sp.]
MKVVHIAHLDDEPVEHLIEIRPHVEEFLERLHRSDKHVILVTNAHRKALDIKLARTGIGRWFHEIVVSHDFKVAKEELAFWHRLHATHPFDKR